MRSVIIACFLCCVGLGTDAQAQSRTICQMYDGPPRERGEVAFVLAPRGPINKFDGREIVYPIWSEKPCSVGPVILEVLPGSHNYFVYGNLPGQNFSLTFDAEAGGSYRIRAQSQGIQSSGRVAIRFEFEKYDVAAAGVKERLAPCWAGIRSGIVRDVDMRNNRFTLTQADGTVTTVHLGNRRQTLVYGGSGARGAIQPGRRVTAFEDLCTKPGFAYRINVESADSPSS